MSKSSAESPQKPEFTEIKKENIQTKNKDQSPLQNGEKVSVLNFTLSDETAFIQGSAWRKKAKKLAETLSVGQIFLFKHVSIKPYRGITQVSVIGVSVIEKLG